MTSIEHLADLFTVTSAFAMLGMLLVFASQMNWVTIIGMITYIGANASFFAFGRDDFAEVEIALSCGILIILAGKAIDYVQAGSQKRDQQAETGTVKGEAESKGA